MTDWDLLQDYVEKETESSFAELVGRHVNIVYATALRQTRDPELAKDITQAVFVLLARKASRLSSSVIIPGWLHRTTVFVASRATRESFRRQQRERESLLMPQQDSGDSRWEHIAPHLDSAIGSLNEIDRLAVILRFLEQRSFREVAERLGLSEDAAKKRVSRALDKLRSLLTRRGHTLAAPLLLSLLATHAAEAAPAAVTLAATQAAVAGHVSPTALALANETSRQWLVTSSAWWVALFTLCIGLGLGVNTVLRGEGPARPSATAARPPEVATPLPDPPPKPEPINEKTNDRFKLVIVADETGSPITNAQAKPTIREHPELGGVQSTDHEGAARFTLPTERFHGMFFIVSAPGRVPLCVSWDRYEQPLVPAEYEVRLRAGRTISGRVVNEAQQPVAGATLHFNGEGINDYSREYVDYRTVSCTTDDSGLWTADFLSERSTYTGRVQHDDYAETDFHLHPGDDVVIVIQKGRNVSGIVADAAGIPVPGANVTIDWQHSWRKALKAVADDTGGFQFPNVGFNALGRTNDFRLTVSAPGYRKLQQMIQPDAPRMDLQITLEAASPIGNETIAGVVLDSDGKPLSGVDIALTPGQAGLGGIDWKTRTGKDGRFSWNQAPTNKLSMSFQAFGFEPKVAVPVSADKENVVLLQPMETIELRLNVFDAENGTAIPRFLVRKGEWSREFSEATRPRMVEFAGEGRSGEFMARYLPGEFGGMTGIEQTMTVLQVEAKDYLSAVLKFPYPLNTSTNLNVSLVPAQAVTGRVLLPDGRPAGGAQVALAEEDQLWSLTAMVKPGIFEDPTRTFKGHTMADPDGTFRIIPNHAFARVLIIHDGGWINARKEELLPGQEIYLRRWGRIEGLLRVENEPGAVIGIRSDEKFRAKGGIDFNYSAKTTDDGFVCEKIPAGEVVISRVLFKDGSAANTHMEFAQVREGETAKVQLGGTGVQLVGRLECAGMPAGAAWGLMPDTLVSADRKRILQFFCKPDGTFSIPDVPPGSYELQARARTEKPGEERGKFVFHGDLRHEMLVPATPGGTLDLGTITIPTYRPRTVRSTAR